MEATLAGVSDWDWWDERCDWSDLYRDQCAHCLGHDWEPEIALNDPEYGELR